jgi:hypothetical protein
MITPTFAIASINNDRSPVLVITERERPYEGFSASFLSATFLQRSCLGFPPPMLLCSSLLSSCENPPRMKNPSRCASLASALRYTYTYTHYTCTPRRAQARARRIRPRWRVGTADLSPRRDKRDAEHTEGSLRRTRRPRNPPLPRARACHRDRFASRAGFRGFTGHAQPDARHKRMSIVPNVSKLRWLTAQVLRSQWFF